MATDYTSYDTREQWTSAAEALGYRIFTERDGGMTAIRMSPKPERAGLWHRNLSTPSWGWIRTPEQMAAA